MLDQLDAGDPWKSQVHQDDVGAQIDHDFDRVVSVVSFADDLEAVARERIREGSADQSLIVNECDCDRLFAAFHDRILPNRARFIRAGPFGPPRGFVRPPEGGSLGPLHR